MPNTGISFKNIRVETGGIPEIRSFVSFQRESGPPAIDLGEAC
jgi:hypothetical protein